MDTLRNNADTPPDRLNEDWRYGRPHVHAQELLRLLEERAGNEGDIRVESSASTGCTVVQAPLVQADKFASIGSEYMVKKALQADGKSLALRVHAGGAATPLTIHCEARGFFVAQLHVVVEPGAHAHIIEQHTHHEAAALVCLRHYTLSPGASLTLELREEGAGSSRSITISRFCCSGDSKLRHISSYKSHVWAREETTLELTAHDQTAPEALLLSANHLGGEQWLDQRTRQIHLSPGGKSRLLYKNVVDDKATAIFGGNIRVEPGAHETDAYLSNLNMMLSEQGTVHSLPGLEILADRVRCSHGSATAPMDAEQLFYLLSRGIAAEEARRMLAEGFLADVWAQFGAEA